MKCKYWMYQTKTKSPILNMVKNNKRNQENKVSMKREYQ